MSNPKANPVGLVIEWTLLKSNGDPHDLSTATEILLCCRTPSKQTLEFTGSLATDGLDGKVQYVVQDGDLTEAGPYAFEWVVTTDTFGPIPSDTFYLHLDVAVRSNPCG